MKRKTKIIITLCIIAFIAVGVPVWVIFLRYPSTVPLGQDPVLILPFYDFSKSSFMQGYGQIHPDFFHDGFDFGVNGTTIIVAMHNCYVADVKRNWYNEWGGHWQTNVELWLNAEWDISIAVESWALNSTYGALQDQAIIVTAGQYLAANQTIGQLLVHGSHAHIHVSVRSWKTDLCPYYYFSSAAKAIFDVEFYKVNITPSWEM